jgi:hypothetical protein
MRRNKRKGSPKMRAQKATRMIVQVSRDNVEDLLEVALEDFFRATKLLKPSDVVDFIRLPPWWDDIVDVEIKLIVPIRRARKKEVEHITYNGA